MLFNSQTFIIFFTIFYIIYVILHHNLRLRNILLLIASYIFYGSWNYQFLALILFSTLVDYYTGSRLGNTSNTQHRRILLLISLSVNLSLLGVFKYTNFFISSFADLLQVFGLNPNITTLSIILPVGISFYTFQTLSYTIDIYRKQLEPIDNFIDFATYVAFFPQLVAGPIERASRLLPQIQQVLPITGENLQAGLYLILLGFFKKVVVADNSAIVADMIFNSYSLYGGRDIIFGILAFAFQIYGDFSGYSDIARGIAKLMGFELMVNFRLPYFANSPSDFWQRWHISLSTWLRDYLYIPLGGNRSTLLKTYRNLIITMTIGGLWHGAAWTFVIWGVYHGIILVIHRILGNLFTPPRHISYRIFQIFIMFNLTLIGWLIFRAESMEQVYGMLTNLFTTGESSLGILRFMELGGIHILILIWLDIWQYRTKNLLIVTHQHWLIQSLIYGLLMVWIALYGVHISNDFIYFQF